MQGNLVVEARDLTFSFGTLQVLNGLSLSVREGEVFGVLGANGSGKTTLMRLMVGLLRHEGGVLAIHGEYPSPRQAARVGYMPQLSALYQELSVRENVDFFARMYGMSDRASRGRSVEEAIALVGLAPRSSDTIVNLSGGMRQRVSLAIALVHRPAPAAPRRTYRRTRPGCSSRLLGEIQADGRVWHDHHGLQPHDG